MIEVCGNIILKNILKHVRAAQLYLIMADEATDAANDQQLSISVRYINHSSQRIDERFLGFSECTTGVTGEAIAKRILEHLHNC